MQAPTFHNDIWYLSQISHGACSSNEKIKINVVISIMIYFKNGTPVSRNALIVSATIVGTWTCTWAK